MNIVDAGEGVGGEAQYDIWMEIVYLGCYLTDTAKSTVD